MRGLAPFWLDPLDETYSFPDVSLALSEPDGLLAIGGTLCPERLISAYTQGIFPWYNEDQPIMWWSPTPRMVLFPEKINISRSLRKTMRKSQFEVTLDHAFKAVIEACQQPRPREPGTWITPDMQNAYCEMHRLGHAHSVECWADGQLVGGLYGLSFGKIFFGESMFSTCKNASKVALATLACQLQKWGFTAIDCQITSQHLLSMGAEEVSRDKFTQLLNDWCEVAEDPRPWKLDIDLDDIISSSVAQTQIKGKS